MESHKIRRNTIALKEGDVHIDIPKGLSMESVGDLEAYFEIFLRKVKRWVTEK